MSSLEQLHITKQKWNSRLNSNRKELLPLQKPSFFDCIGSDFCLCFILRNGLNIGFITITLRCLSLLLEPGFSCEDILARRYINITSFIVNSGNIQIQIRIAVIRSKFCIVAFLTVDSHIGLVSVNDKVSLTKR